MACGNSVLVESLLPEPVTEQQMGSEILVQSVSEQPSCSEPLLDSDVDHASVPDGALGLSRNDNAGFVISGEVTESCKVDRDGFVGEHENANDLDLRSRLNGDWRLNRCCSTESQSNVDGSNRESDGTCLKEGGPELEDGSAASVGDCDIPLEVICQIGSSGDGVQQDELRDDKSVSCLYSKEVMEVTEEKGDISLEIKNDNCEPVSPLQGGEIPSELAEMEACSSPHTEEKGFNILAGPSLEAAYEERVVSGGIEADLCNKTSPVRDVGMHSEVSYACGLVTNCDNKNEQMDDNGVNGPSSLSTERTTEVVEMKSNVDTCTQIFPSQGLERALEDLHMPDLPSSCAQQNDQSSDKIADGSLVERSIDILEKNSDSMTDLEAVILTQMSPVKVNVYYSKEGPSEIASSCIIEKSVSMQSCQTLGVANNSVSGLSTDMVVDMKSNTNQIWPPEGCERAFEGSDVSDSLRVCSQENGQRNDKVIDFAFAERVTDILEKKSDATTDTKVEIGTQISVMEEKVSNLNEGSGGLSPNNIHEKSVSLKPFQPFDIVKNGPSESVDVPDNNDSPGNIDSSISLDCSGEKYHEGIDNVKVGCVSKTKFPDIVALSSRRSGRSRKTNTKRAPRKGRSTSKELQPLGSLETVFKAAGRKRSCLSKPARSSVWGLLGSVTQSFEESNRLEVSQGKSQVSQKRRSGQRSGQRNQSGAGGNSQGSRGKNRASTNRVRLKVKVGKEFCNSSLYITVPEDVDTSASANSVKKGDGNEGNWRKEATVGEDRTYLDAPVLDVDLANKDFESVVLTENSADNVIDNYRTVPSHTVAVSSGGSFGTSFTDPGTSPDSEIINIVPDADVEARQQEDSHGDVLTSDKVLAASGDFISTKRGNEKHKVPHAKNYVWEGGKLCPASLNKEMQSERDGCRQSLDFSSSEMRTSSTCANASSNSSSDKESSLEALHLSGETDPGISGDVLKVEVGADNLDVGLGLSKSQSSKSKGLKPPKGRSRACGSASKKGNAHRLTENRKKSANKKKVMEKADGDQVSCEVANLPESGNHLVDNNRKTNSVNDAECVGVPNSDMVPVNIDKQYLPPRNAWVLCDDCHKWRRIPAELADIIDEQKCTWTCKDNKDEAFADCSIRQEKSNSEINAELDISDASGDEDASVTRSKYKELECRRPTVSQQNVASIKINQFHHRSRKTQNIDEIMVCHCKPPSDGQLGCGDDCLNRILNIECVRGACPCRDLCSNQQFQKRRYAKLEKFRSGKKGFGLRLLEDICKGQFLIEYVGEVLDTNAYEARQKEYAVKGHRHFYFMTLNGSEVIDACAKGNLGRFINHSCDPNCRTEKWMVNGEICIGLFALRDIKKGEEVTFDYNYVRVFGAAAKKCHCGSSQCRGYIGGDPLDTEVIVQDDSDEEYMEPVMIPEDGVSEDRSDNTLPANKVIDNTTVSIGELEFTTQREESMNRSDSLVSHLHDSLELKHPRQKPSSVPPVETEDVASIPIPAIEQEIFGEKETTEKSSNSSERLETTPVKLLGKSLSDGTDSNRKSKSGTIEVGQVPSKVCSNVKTSKSTSFVKKSKVKITPSGNKIQMAATKSLVLSIKPKRLTEGSVEEKLNELLDGDGGINKRKDSTKGYLKLLILTAVSGDSGSGEVIQSNRDLSMILDALLKTKSRMVLIDVINKNGLRMLHNIMKKYREDFKKIPILRKLLKVLEYLAMRHILTSEHITGGPPCAGMESFMESMLSLTEHEDRQVHQIARNFRDKWIPRPFRRHGYVDRVDSKMEFNRGSNSNRFSPSHDNWRDQSGRSTEAIDSAKQSMVSTSVSTGVQEVSSAPCTGGGPTSETKVRKRKSRWDQPADPDSSLLQNKEQKSESGLHRQLAPSPLPGIGEMALHLKRVSGEDGTCSSSVHRNCQQNDGTEINLDDLPPGFDAPAIPSFASSSFCPLKCPAAPVIGHPQEKFVSRLPISYGIPLSVMQQYGTPHLAPGIPFLPFPPLPLVPRHKKGPSPSHPINHVAVSQPAEGQHDRCVPATSHSNDSSPSTTGANQAEFNIPCVNNQCASKRPREFSNDLGRRYFKQQKYWNHNNDNNINTKFGPPSFGDRNGWGCNGNNSQGGANSSIGVGNVANEHTSSFYAEDLSYRVERAGNNASQHSQHH
ncbi:hypothetical protein ACFX2I_017158 [Malus domestica]|nr:histone-lysine N-methyltransferase ASHH2 isoform X1 [Malus domestica]